MFYPSTVHNSGSENLIWINKEEEKSDCAYFMYDLSVFFLSCFIHFSPLPPKKNTDSCCTATLHHQPPAASSSLPHCKSARCSLCFSLSDWGLTPGLLPSPSANTGLDSYHVSSHYQQSRAPGRQWEDSGRGMERERGRRNGHPSLLCPLVLSGCHSAEMLTNKEGMEAEARHAQVGGQSRAEQSRQRREQAGMERWEEREQGSKSSGFGVIRAWCDSFISPSNRQGGRWIWDAGWCWWRRRREQMKSKKNRKPFLHLSSKQNPHLHKPI